MDGISSVRKLQFKAKTRWERQRDEIQRQSLFKTTSKQKPQSKCRPEGIRNKTGEMGCCLRKGNGDGRNRGLGEEALASETMETVEVMPQWLL